MILTRPFIEPNARIDFYAGNENSYQSLKALYQVLDDGRRGVFYVSPDIHSNGIATKQIDDSFDGCNPLVLADYGDLSAVFHTGEDRPLIMYEPQHNTDTRGLINIVSLFLCADPRTEKFRKAAAGSEVVMPFKTAQDATEKLVGYVRGKEIKHVTHIDGHTVGVVYMSFGQKAALSIRRSILTLNRIGFSYPVTVIGDTKVEGCDFIPWLAESPFDLSQRKNFKFRAGRIKPYLYYLSPYEYTLYMDADTAFIRPITAGFESLGEFDIAVTEEMLTLGELYNKKLAGWEINLIERDTTIVETGGDESQHFINSGVIFFKKSEHTQKVFYDWYFEWMRFQEWDEQLALTRAIHVNQAKVKRLGVQWNSPHPEHDTVIFHNYGRGSVRTNPA